MKKIYLTIICLILTFSLFSCEKADNTSLDESSESTSLEVVSSDDTNQKLLLYKRTSINGTGEIDYILIYDYNQWGKISIETSEDQYGNISKTENQYDDEGNIVKSIYKSNEGIVATINEYIYNEKGNLINKIYKNNDGIVTTKKEYIYNDKENILEIKSNNLIDNTSSGKIYSYDNEDRIVEILKYGNIEEKIIYTYDMDGNFTITSGINPEEWIEYYNRDGKLTETHNGSSKCLLKYDENGNEIEEKRYRNEELIRNKESTYNDSGNIIEIKSYENGQLLSVVNFEYDENGNNIKVTKVNSIGLVLGTTEMEYKLFPVT